MRQFPATGRRLLQAIGARHVRPALHADSPAGRRVPVLALASGAVVVACGALLAPGGNAVAQPAPAAQAVRASVFTVEDTLLGRPADQHAQPAGKAHDSAHDAIVAGLANGGPHHDADRDPVVAALAPAAAPRQDAPAAQQQAASRSEQRTELPAAQPAAPAAPAAPAEQPAPAPAPAPAEQPAPKPAWSSPAPGASISNPFHRTNAAYAAGYHTGTDFAVSVGTPVLAVGDSTVVSAGWAGAYGNQIVLKLSDGRFAQYAHLSQLGVGAGQHVDAGQQVGRSGNTGNSHGPHLHFEIRTANEYAKVIDPIAYLKGHGADNF
ncbi:M23 family metallopeptidase [Kitasatospora sp. NPDC088134]|uniref:M23 family metallopeptidase n=1 Tax=Kitasatospora sp. NPDC088134 TaxID=3364071 RepID=UPI003806EA80